jgi:hypothetical protein
MLASGDGQYPKDILMNCQLMASYRAAKSMLNRNFGILVQFRPNNRFEESAEKLRFSVPRLLRHRAAPQAKR